MRLRSEDGQSLDFFAQLQRELKEIDFNTTPVHEVAMGQGDTYTLWQKAGLKPGVPAYFIELSPSELKKHLPFVKDTPLAGGLTLIAQPGKKEPRITMMAAVNNSIKLCMIGK